MAFEKRDIVSTASEARIGERTPINLAREIVHLEEAKPRRWAALSQQLREELAALDDADFWIAKALVERESRS